MKQKTWGNAGNIKPEIVRAIVKSIKEIDPGFFGGVPDALVLGFVATESSFRTGVESNSTEAAIGLMQVKPSTYKWLMGLYPDLPWQNAGLKNPIENILAGMAFIVWIQHTSGLGFFAQIQSYNTGVAGYKRGSRAKDYAVKVLTNSFTFII